MKSIRQWKLERGVLSEEFEKSPFARYMGSTRVEVNPDLERELKPKIKNIMDSQEFKSLPKSDLLDKIKVVISQVVAEMGGSKVNTKVLAKNIDPDSPSGVEIGRFARMMGSNEMSVDQGLRRELRPKIERIMDMEEFKSMPKDELERELIAVASKIVAEISGRSFGVDGLDKKLNEPSDSDQIAKESKIVPSFLTWAEQNEQPAPDARQDQNQGAVSEPQHKQGEGNMDLKSVVEKKMMELAMELEADGKGSRQDVLSAMKAVIDSTSKETEGNSPDQSKPSPEQQQPAGQPLQGDKAQGGPAPLGGQPPVQM